MNADTYQSNVVVDTDSKVTSFPFTIPGTTQTLMYKRNERGCLIELSCNGMVYIRGKDDGDTRIYGNDLVTVSRTITPGGVLRLVKTPQQSWCEKFLWDKNGLMTHVDGVTMSYDTKKRITRCDTPEGTFQYVYNDADLYKIISPRNSRTIINDQRHRPVGLHFDNRKVSFTYDEQGKRTDVSPTPAHYMYDTLGRLWIIKDKNGAIIHTFLWDGFFCLCRIDGKPGDPVSAVFSLDTTGTPVRIITRDKTVRVYRDAFGESLLGYHDVPGLFGSIGYNGKWYFRSRVFDPAAGYFTSPDPLDGSENDRRRNDGYTGPLLVEHPESGQYCICQHNPVSRADFCGENSGGFTFLMALSDVTWSLQNNLLGWLGYEGFLSLWISLFSGNIDRYGWSDGVYSERTGSYGVLRDGVFANDRAKTFQHIIITTSEHINELADVRVFDPQQQFQPNYYGSVLRIVPESGKGDPFIIRGARNPGTVQNNHRPETWTRYGGPASASLPGSSVPCFPSGGFHFDSRDGMRGPMSASCTECIAGQGLTTGTLDERIVLVLAIENTGIAQDGFVLLTDTAAGYEIGKVIFTEERDGRTKLRLDALQGSLAQQNLTLRGLAAENSRQLNQGSQNDRLDAINIGVNAYTVDKPLYITQDEHILSAKINSFEAGIQIDDTITGAGFTAPLTLFRAVQTGATNSVLLTADNDTLDFAAGPVPSLNETITVTGSGVTLAVTITEELTATTRRVDRNVSALGAPGDTIQWRNLTAQADSVGTVDSAVPTGTDITYTAPAPGQAPNSGFIVITDSAAPQKRTARTVTARDFDDIVISKPLIGAAADPYTVDSFTIVQPADPAHYTSLALQTEQILAVENPDVITEDTVALQLQQIAGSADITAASTGAAIINAVTLTQPAAASPWRFTVSLPWAGHAALTPHQFVYLVNGADIAPELTSDIKSKLVFTHQRALNPSGIELVCLEETDPTYYADFKDSTPNQTRITVLPLIDVGGVQTRVQMPRFLEKEIVRVTCDSTTTDPATGNPVVTAEQRLFRITSISGTTLTMDSDNQLIGTMTNMRITRLVPSARDTGWSRVGIDGVPVGNAVGGKVTANEVWFNVYNCRPLYGAAINTPLAIVDGDDVFPAQIDPAVVNVDYEVFFKGTPAHTGVPVDVHIPDVAMVNTAFVPSFSREGDAFLIPGPAPNINPGTDVIAVIPLVETATTAANGRMNSGSTLVPEDPEHWEFDRKQSLIEHELIHTRQCCVFGPLLTAWFPLGWFESLLEFTTGIEEPEFSPYISATIESSEGSRYLVIQNPGGITFEKDDNVQIAQRGATHRVTLGDNSSNPNRFRISQPPSTLSNGDVSIRKIQSGGTDFGQVVINLLQLTTAGGLLNSIVGGFYGMIFWLIGHGIHALRRVNPGNSEQYHAVSVEEEGRKLRLANEQGIEALRGANRIIVKSGENNIVRECTVSNDEITVTTPISFTENVQVTAYSLANPQDTWDWYDYFPARVENLSMPARITIDPVGSQTLTLALHDRVIVRIGEQTNRTIVTHVQGNIVELEEAPTLVGEDRTLRIAKVSSRDPMGWWDDWFLESMDMDWMKWLFDPWGQFDYQLRPEGNWGWITRVGRYLFGTQSWSMLPALGWFWWDNAFKQIGGNGHLSYMEQEASEESGDLYSPMSRLRGTLNYVGDIARFWYFPFFWRRTLSVITDDQMDEPGVHYENMHKPRILPLVQDTGVDQVPNGRGESPPDSGLCLADILTQRDWNAPFDPAAAGPNCFIPSDLSLIPTSSTLERCGGSYVAFTRSGNHRISIRNPAAADVDFDTIVEAAEAHEGGAVYPEQPILFNKNIRDVNVTCAGLTVNNDDTVTLVATQHAQIVVTPNNDRRYAVTVTDPTESAFLRNPENMIIAAQTTDTTDNQLIEISRVYTFTDAANPQERTYDYGQLNHHKAHLLQNIHIPVRLFNIAVVKTISFKSAVPDIAALSANFDENRIQEVRPGAEIFLLVPANNLSPLHKDSVNYTTPPPAGYSDPSPSITTEEPSEELSSYIGEGNIFKVTFNQQDPPEEEVDITFKVGVGEPGNSTELEAVIKVIPHFRLVNGGGYQVAQGSDITLTCDVRPGDPAAKIGTVVVTPSEGISTEPTADESGVKITASATAATTTRRVLVEDGNAEGHFAVRTITVV